MDITVGQFQMLYRISKDEGLHYLDKVTESVAVLSGKTVRQVEDMDMQEFNKLATRVTEILTKEIVSEPKRVLKVNGKMYGITYEPAKLRAGQYIEIQHFLQGDFIENLHYILASLTYPVKKTLFGLRKGKNNSMNHEQISFDMQDVKMIDAYSACVFFCEVLKVSIEGLRDYLAKETGMKKQEIQELLTGFTQSMDGLIQPNKLQTLRT
jgi:hypothetical protein